MSIEEILSDFKELAYGVPQGSVLGPIEFIIYTTILGAILRHYSINYHIYADDIQLYCSFDVNSPSEAISQIHSCTSDIRTWMIMNKLKINDDETEFPIITSPDANFQEDIQLHVGQEYIHSSSACKSLVIMLDNHFGIGSQIKKICIVTYFHLCNIVTVRTLLTNNATTQLLHSLITSRLGYCNSLLYGLPGTRIAPLQRV